MIGGQSNPDVALNGATERKLEILMLLDPGRELGSRPPYRRNFAWPKGRAVLSTGDVPTGRGRRGLFARRALLNELMRTLTRTAGRPRCSSATAQLEAEAGEILDHGLQALDSAAPTSTTCLLHGFARELRIGAFENSPDRKVHARAILWRLTVARLRRSNPEFLAANGFA
jgi:hypothetical protein